MASPERFRIGSVAGLPLALVVERLTRAGMRRRPTMRWRRPQGVFLDAVGSGPVIGMPGGDHRRTVQLFGQHQAHQHVRQGQRA